jgi:hypothetical protein
VNELDSNRDKAFAKRDVWDHPFDVISKPREAYFFKGKGLLPTLPSGFNQG